jgi:ATP-dependent protease Clp ATPase subunit
MEETEVDLKVPHDPVSQIQAIEHYRRTGKKDKRTLNTRHILFIVSGAFNGLDRMVKERISKQEIGFRGEMTSRELDRTFLKHVTAEDLIKYGFESEFVGRLPVIAVLEELTADDLYAILQNPNNPIITSKKRDFRAYGIDIAFEDEALKMLAAQAAIEKTGARGLVSVIERVLIQYEKRLPSTEVKRVVVTPEVVEHPQEELERLLANPEDPQSLTRFTQAAVKEREILKESIRRREPELLNRYHLPLTETRVELLADRYHHWDCDLKTAMEDLARLRDQVRRFAEKFRQNHGIELHFEPDAVDAILQQAVDRGVSAMAVCQEMAQDLEYALKLVRDRTSQDQFILTRESLGDLDAYLNRVIREYYQTTLFRE